VAVDRARVRVRARVRATCSQQLHPCRAAADAPLRPPGETPYAPGMTLRWLASPAVALVCFLAAVVTLGQLAASTGRGACRIAQSAGGQKPKLTPRQVRIAREMYDETGPSGQRRYTVAQIAAEFGVTRPTIYRHLAAALASSPATGSRQLS
jgi:predicted DNA binding protein